MKKLTPDQFAAYMADPEGMDFQLRRWCEVSDDKYYSVSVWPEHLAGRVWVTPNMHRVVQREKISKSRQS